jgi:hypothetical protein
MVEDTVAYFRAFLSGMAALILAIYGPAFFISFRHGDKATGVDLLWALSPLTVILAIVFFAMFFAASRLQNRPLRLLLFWTPVTLISTLGLGLLALVVDAWFRFHKHQ